MHPYDVDAVARLHLDSWRTAYRGVLSDAYLDARAEADRLAHWTRRLETVGDYAFGIVAERNGEPIGFAYLMRSEGLEGATLLDNLHVSPALRGAGNGPQLLDAAAHELLDRGWDHRLQLWVFAANTGARRFYERLGARAVRFEDREGADGAMVPAVAYVWDDARGLVRSKS